MRYHKIPPFEDIPPPESQFDHILHFSDLRNEKVLDISLEEASCSCGSWTVYYDQLADYEEFETVVSEARRQIINLWSLDHVASIVPNYRHARTRLRPQLVERSS